MVRINTFANVELLEMLHGSSVLNTDFSTSEKDVWVEELRQVVLENGVIAYNAKQKQMFTQLPFFTASMKETTVLNSVASLILHGVLMGGGLVHRRWQIPQTS